MMLRCAIDAVLGGLCCLTMRDTRPGGHLRVIRDQSRLQPMPRRLALALFAAVTAPARVVAQGQETDTLSTASPLARVAYLTQLDRLAETRSDEARCSAAALLNAFVLPGGSIDTVARLFGLPPDHTIATAHRVQDRRSLHALDQGTCDGVGDS